MPGQRSLAKTIAEKGIKLVFKLYFHLFHRIRITGLEHIPSPEAATVSYGRAGQPCPAAFRRSDGRTGSPALPFSDEIPTRRLLIISNHASFLDGLIIWTYLNLDLKILVDRTITRKWFMKLLWVDEYILPIDSLNPYALKEAIKYVEQETALLIFPEGRISVTGNLMKIYEGAGLITFKTRAHILPIYLDTYNTVFSRKRGKKRWLAPITITIAKLQDPMDLDLFPPKQRKKEAAARIYQTFCELFYVTRNKPTTLRREFIRLCRENRGKIALKDATGQEVSYRKALLSAFIMGKYFSKYPDSTLGLLLPNLSITALLFMGLQLFKKVPAFLNYASGLTALNQSMDLAKIRVLVTSRQFLERIKIGEENFRGRTVVYLEDMQNSLSPLHKLEGLGRALFPRPYSSAGADEHLNTAVILFTSGSEGVPKAVCLTHENIISNIYQCLAKIDVRENDFLLNPLPMFHSFGLTVGTLLPLFANAKAFLYINPLHYRIVPEIAYDQNCTAMIATNTFLRGFGRRAHPYDFYSMRYIFCGAEALSDGVFETYGKVYGVRVLTGYGATECSPVITINNALENQHGTVGKFLPGIAYKILPVAGIEHDNGRVGQLYVKGKNVMLGYLNNEKANHKFLVEDAGWYDTGDVVEMTREGFLKIRGRVKRFAKISGEMISLTAVEEALAPLTTGREAIAVLGLPDEVKGEKLMAVTNIKNLDAKKIREALKSQGFSDLACPREIRLIGNIPKLGSGKIDYVSLKAMLDY